ncbi:thyroid transcription factor 1-associated protein 26 [Nymphalis io]|uniref:thyroid transcription factor 1-associated protein 26 n=1 Tax=Inachis io TaxID=171585 RepID=UPI0021680168|nr:thyroid transcription factor 1-associated protein 26 [Nymphalis io]
MENKRDSFFLKNKKQKPNKGQEKKEFKSKNERQKNFDDNRHGLDETEKETGKKPFDKKTYRLKKYSKKYKLEKWEEQRKMKMLHEYQKSIKDDPMVGSYKTKPFDEDTTDANPTVGRFVKHPDLLEKGSSVTRNKDPYTKAKERFNKIKQEKIEKQQAVQKANQERFQKLQEYKKKKNERFKKLSKKTKKGQPVMTGRLELLLEKIQSSK